MGKGQQLAHSSRKRLPGPARSNEDQQHEHMAFAGFDGRRRRVLPLRVGTAGVSILQIVAFSDRKSVRCLLTEEVTFLILSFYSAVRARVGDCSSTVDSEVTVPERTRTDAWGHLRLCRCAQLLGTTSALPRTSLAIGRLTPYGRVGSTNP